MKSLKDPVFIVVITLLVGGVTSALAQGTAFTYQGRLQEDGTPAHGTYDLRFIMYNAATGGTPGGVVSTNGIAVDGGLFTVTLDFGSAPFDGSPRWLQIEARTNGIGASYVPLAPRQALRPTPYAIFAGNVADGAITSSKLAPGAVTTAAIASNSITSAQLGIGAVTSNNLAPGVVGTAQLAKPYQSGSVSLESFVVQGFSTPYYLASNTVTFATPFPVRPVVTVSLETPLSTAADRIQPIRVREKRTNGFDLTFPVQNLPVPLATRSSIDIAPLTMVNGRPGVVYRTGAGTLSFARALDATGRRWPGGTSVGVTASSGMALMMVGGNPAVAYIDTTNNLKFIRATETNGATWGTPVTVQAAVAGVMRPSDHSLALINGRPALACWDSEGEQIWYYRANDTNGASWPAGTFVTNGNSGISLSEINGRPAISYPWDNGQPTSSTMFLSAVRYIRADDANGAGWTAAAVNATTDGPLRQFSDTFLFPVATNPAVVFMHLEGGQFPSTSSKYVRSTTLNGGAWGSVVKVFLPANATGGHYATVVAGQPAIVWYDGTVEAMRYSTSANLGTSFFVTYVYRNIGNSLPGLLDVGGRPAVTLSAADAGELWYVRETNLIPDTYINWIAVQP